METIKPDELWHNALEEFGFNQEELEAIGSRLKMIPQELMFDNGAAHGSLDLDRYHFMEQRAKDMKVEDKKSPIKNKCKYLIKVLENNYLPKSERRGR